MDSENQEEPLDKDQYSRLYSCYHRKDCSLWNFNASSEYWGGYGTSAHFVLIDLKSFNLEHISNTTYCE